MVPSSIDFRHIIKATTEANTFMKAGLRLA